MELRALGLLPLCAAAALGCGGDETEPAPPEDPAPTCEAPEFGLPDGSCIRPGVPPDGCAEGFVHDGEYGCEPILPAEPCPFGLMAVPGDAECRPVMECGEGTWGDLPTDSATQHVDGSYAGGDSDGSAAAPWTTIGDAVTAAAPDALVAVAAGSYVEDVRIEDKPVRLWGRCPEMVEIVGSATSVAAVQIRPGASGTEVGGLAARGDATGVGISGSEDVRLERLWVHSATLKGVAAEVVLGPTSVAVVGTLIEHNTGIGLFAWGSEALVEGTVVRDTLPPPSDQTRGRGIIVQMACASGSCEPTPRAAATIRGSLLEQNHVVGLTVTGSDVLIEGSVVRNTLPGVPGQTFGRGISVQPCSEDHGCDPAGRSDVTVRGSLLEQNHDLGLFVMGSDALVERTVVRNTLPEASDQTGGRGISIQLLCSGGICDPTVRGNATVRGSLVEQNHDAGLAVIGSDALVEGTAVRATTPRASDGLFGDGLLVGRHDAPATAAIIDTFSAESARAGLANFGASVSLGSTHIQCAGFELNGEPLEEQDYVFEDLGGNGCGCPTADASCVVQSAGLQPPDPIAPAE